MNAQGCDRTDVKTYLRQLARMDKRIDALLERREHYRSMATRGTATYTAMRMGGTNQRSKVEDYVVKLIDLEHEIDQEIDKYADATSDARAMIDMIADERYRDILNWRYLNGWDWDRVAAAMGYERAMLYRLHGLGLQEYQKINNYYRPEATSAKCSGLK